MIHYLDRKGYKYTYRQSYKVKVTAAVIILIEYFWFTWLKFVVTPMTVDLYCIDLINKFQPFFFFLLLEFRLYWTFNYCLSQLWQLSASCQEVNIIQIALCRTCYIVYAAKKNVHVTERWMAYLCYWLRVNWIKRNFCARSVWRCNGDGGKFF